MLRLLCCSNLLGMEDDEQWCTDLAKASEGHSGRLELDLVRAQVHAYPCTVGSLWHPQADREALRAQIAALEQCNMLLEVRLLAVTTCPTAAAVGWARRVEVPRGSGSRQVRRQPVRSAVQCRQTDWLFVGWKTEME